MRGLAVTEGEGTRYGYRGGIVKGTKGGKEGNFWEAWGSKERKRKSIQAHDDSESSGLYMGKRGTGTFWQGNSGREKKHEKKPEDL